MFTVWDEEFDRVCGTNITSIETNPLEDSGLWDILHGPERPETEIVASEQISSKMFTPDPEYDGGIGHFAGR